MAKRPRPVRDRIIDAALDLAAERPWRDIGLGDIAAAAKQPLAKLHEQFSSKTAIVLAVMERTNSAMLADADPAALLERGSPHRVRSYPGLSVRDGSSDIRHC